MKKIVLLAVAAALAIPASGLAGKNGVKSKEPAAAKEEAKAPAPSSDEPAPEAATAKERKWRADIDKDVTAHEEDAKRLVKNCGQDIPFNMDWKGFKMAEWDGINLAAFCIGDLPSRLAEN